MEYWHLGAKGKLGDHITLFMTGVRINKTGGQHTTFMWKNNGQFV